MFWWSICFEHVIHLSVYMLSSDRAAGSELFKTKFEAYILIHTQEGTRYSVCCFCLFFSSSKRGMYLQIINYSSSTVQCCRGFKSAFRGIRMCFIIWIGATFLEEHGTLRSTTEKQLAWFTLQLYYHSIKLALYQLTS